MNIRNMRRLDTRKRFKIIRFLDTMTLEELAQKTRAQVCDLIETTLGIAVSTNSLTQIVNDDTSRRIRFSSGRSHTTRFTAQDRDVELAKAIRDMADAMGYDLRNRDEIDRIVARRPKADENHTPHEKENSDDVLS